MMREIKFRGQRVDTKEWVYGDLCQDCIGNKYIRCVDYNEKDEIYSLVEVIPESVGQFTGLKDKKKVEIYEHDRVKGWIPDTEKDIYNFKGLIAFMDGGFVVTNLWGDYAVDLAYCTSNDTLEVIENIPKNNDSLECVPEEHDTK